MCLLFYWLALLLADMPWASAEHLRRLFDTPPDPASQPFSFPADVLRLLSGGGVQPAHAALGRQPDPPLRVPAAYVQKGQAAVRRLSPELVGAQAARLLRRYGRLLALEEAAMEQDICRQGGAACWLGPLCLRFAF